MKKRMLYLINVNWGWIKQRPQYLAEELAKYYKVEVWQKKEYKKKTEKTIFNDLDLKVENLFRLPFESNNIISKANYYLIAHQLNEKIKQNDIIWLSDASFFSAMKVPDNKLLVYDCMDDNLEFPYIKNNSFKKKRFLQSEKELLEKCDVCFFSSDYLAKVLSDRYNIDLSSKMCILNNAIKKTKDCISIKKINREDEFHICYIGTVASWLDFELLDYSIKEIPGIVYDIYGPKEVDIPYNEKIKYHGILEHEKVYDVMKKSDLLVMPFKKIPLILAVNPVKLYEYIKSGRPSLAVRYKESERFSPFVSLYNDKDEYVSLIRQYKENIWNPKFNENDIAEFIKENTWDKRGEFIRERLEVLL